MSTVSDRVSRHGVSSKARRPETLGPEAGGEDAVGVTPVSKERSHQSSPSRQELGGEVSEPFSTGRLPQISFMLAERKTLERKRSVRVLSVSTRNNTRHATC